MDIHAVTAAVLLKKFLGPSYGQSQDALVSADGALKRADVSQPPNHTWHGPSTSNALKDLRTSAGKVSAAALDNSKACTGSITRASQFDLFPTKQMVHSITALERQDLPSTYLSWKALIITHF